MSKEIGVNLNEADCSSLSKCIPKDVLTAAEEARNSLIPEKSRNRYDSEYNSFNQWREKKAIRKMLNETVVLAYMSELAKIFKPSSLWTKFSMLKKSLLVNDNVDISTFGKVMAFMKNKNINYLPKKSKTLTVEECRKFLAEAPDDLLLCKTVLVFGLYGACRRDELLKLTIDDIDDHEKYVLVKLRDTKTHTPRSFVIPDVSSTFNPYEFYRRYASLRPPHVTTRRFFLGYREGKCVSQPAGMHTIGGVPKRVATFLGLDHPENYTGHCLRRSGASMVAESCGNILPVKQIGGWKSSKVAEQYVEQSIKGKVEVAKMVLSVNSNDSSADGLLSSSHIVGNNAIGFSHSHSPGLNITGNSNCTINVHLPPKNS